MFLAASDLWAGGPSSLSSDEASTDWLEGPLLMMTQEEFMDVLAMKRQGMSFKEIGDELGLPPGDDLEVGPRWRPAIGAERRRRGPGHRCGVGRPADCVAGRQPAAAGQVAL